MEFSAAAAACPICNLSLPISQLERHANDHFKDDEEQVDDLELAKQISLFPQHSFNYPPSTSDTPETSTSVRIKGVTSNGWENHDFVQTKELFYKVEGGLIPLLRNCLELDSDNSVSILSGHVDHFQSTKDVGWGCGWRNIQMLSSHLLAQRPQVRQALYGGSEFVPDVESLQRWLELAWENGFDAAGSLEFDKKIYGQKRWIGTTECAALLRSFGLRARIVDFYSKEMLITGRKVDKRKITQVYGPMDMFLSEGKLDPSQTDASGNKSYKYSSFSSDKGHQLLNEWVWDYFSDKNVNKTGNRRVVLSHKAPLYFQHDGHSRTIVGIQAKRQRNGMQKYNLLIFDPGERTRGLENSLRGNKGWQKLIKRGVHTLRKPQYQLCYVDGGIAEGEELEKLKTLDSIRKEF